MLAAFLIVLSEGYSQQITIGKVWEVTEGIHVPESVLYYAPNNKLYVSLIGKDGTDKGEIAIIRPDGQIENLHWVTGLNAPKGMAIYKDLLYIADVTKVITVDIYTGNMVDELTVPEATFLNDVTVDDNGVVYISDTRENKIFQLKNGKISLYMENVPSVNGLKYHKGMLLALAGKELWAIDAQKQVKVIAKGFEHGGDGIEPINGGGFIVTCWPGLVYFVSEKGEIQKLQDVQGKMNTADLGYNPKENIIYIPTFNSNSIIAYKIN